MDEKLLKSFESMLKKGNYAEIEPLLKEFAALNPEDWEAKMLLGTCRMLQGDTETAGQVNESLNRPGDSIFHVIVTGLSVFVFFLRVSMDSVRILSHTAWGGLYFCFDWLYFISISGNLLFQRIKGW